MLFVSRLFVRTLLLQLFFLFAQILLGTRILCCCIVRQPIFSMFAKLVGKVKTVGQHDVGSLDMFLLSDSDSDDEAGSGYFENLKKNRLRREKIAKKYQDPIEKKVYRSTPKVLQISSKRKRKPNKLKLDPIETAKAVKHQLPIDWDPPYEDDLVKKKDAVELEKFNEVISRKFSNLRLARDEEEKTAFLLEELWMKYCK